LGENDWAPFCVVTVIVKAVGEGVGDGDGAGDEDPPPLPQAAVHAAMSATTEGPTSIFRMSAPVLPARPEQLQNGYLPIPASDQQLRNHALRST
jgi:hypothetical protein